MTRFDAGELVATLAAVLACVSVTGCGSDSGSAGNQQGVSTSSGSIQRSDALTTATALQINGSPLYSFQPTINAPNTLGLKFAITNSPPWAKFDSKTGKLSGTPAASQVGTYAGITISAVQGTTRVTLPAFTIAVADANSIGNVTLSWQAPTENADGTQLTDLKGYKVHYGMASKRYSQTIQLANAGLVTYVVQNLNAGKYYFAVTAYNSQGRESTLSSEVSTQVD
jgi:Putative Ig domain